MGLWQKEDLWKRCLDETKAKPLPGDPPRTVLTPEKVKVILSKKNAIFFEKLFVLKMKF